MIFFPLLFITAEIFKVKYLNMDDNPLSKFKFDRRKFKLNVDNKKFIFTNGSKNYITNPCVFTLEQEDSFGYLRICDEYLGLICTLKECWKLESTKDTDPYSVKIDKYSLNKVTANFENFYKSEITNISKKLSDDGLIIKNELRLVDKKILQLKIALINDYDRYKSLNKKANDETLEIFDMTRKILNSLKFKDFMVDIFLSINLNRTTSNLISSKLKDPLTTLESKISKIKSINNKLYDSDLIILITNDKFNDREGMSYLNGLEDRETKYIIVNLDQEDTIFYKAKVLVHEILHTLGSSHDEEGDGFLMDKNFLDKNDKKVLLSEKSVKDIEKFVIKNKKRLFK
ncbi:zinc-dependent metalloproteinase [Vairimorpha necatrix]|uniref:Zinc-dependent metalloproteinase n=1 Tax=Vairimorpha necatrix TaxID=6039 RepID=A0AAX4JC93_9MICR